MHRRRRFDMSDGSSSRDSAGALCSDYEPADETAGRFLVWSRAASRAGAAVASRQPTSLGIDHWKYVVFKDPNWDYKTMDFDKDIALADKLDADIGINAIDPNLKPFFAHGGKLIQYHGWTDPLIPPQNSINYYESVGKAFGGLKQVKNNYRLFMVPGMDHCGGGDGPNTFDTLDGARTVGRKRKGAGSNHGDQGRAYASTVPISAG